MALTSDRVEVALWSYGGSGWGVQVNHEQSRSWFGNPPAADRVDHYDFAGTGAIEDQVLLEISSLVAELLGYSAERVMGLQLALF